MISMNSAIRTFLCGIICLATTMVSGQPVSNPEPRTPYSKGQNAWLNEKGFYVVTYDWSDKEINSKLDQAILNRTLGKVTLLAAVGSLLVGGVYYMSNEMAEDPAHKNGKYSGFFKVSAGLAVLSVTFSLNARGKVKKAVDLKGY